MKRAVASSARGLATLLLALGAAASGCARGPEPPREVARRLVDLLPAARFEGEVELVDLGEPQARRHLVDGWHDDEPETSEGRSWLWSRGGSSSLRLWLAQPRPLRLELRCRPHQRFTAGLPVDVLVNGTQVTSVTLAPGPRVYGLEVPRTALRAGDNRVSFEYRARIHGRRAVAWDSVRVRSTTAPAERAAAPPGEEIRVPFHSAVSFALEAPAGARLDTALAAEGSAGALRVVVEGEDGSREEHRLEPGEDCCEGVPLAADATRLVRLTLRGEPDGGGDGVGVLRVLAPRVTVPVAATAAASPAPGPAATATAAAAAAGVTPPGDAAARPNIIVYLVDTLRADRLGVYGNPDGLTPNLDAFAREATLFENAVAQAPWTRPSVATLFTGVGPLRHAVTRLEHRLPAAAVTLAERLRDAGYDTAAVSSNAHVTRATGLTQGFQHVQFLPRQPAAEVVHRLATEWLESRRDAAPYLLYLHVLEPHAPYSPPADLRARYAPEAPPAAGSRAWLERLYRARGPARRELAAPLPALYDGEVAAADRAFGDLRQALEERGEWDRLLVVVVSDHGEGLGERGVVGHAQDLYQEAIAVPLIVKWPGERRGRRVDALAQHVDVLPTLLAAAGLPAPPDATGVDLATLGAAAGAGERAAISHLDYRGRAGMSAVWGRWKWIEPLTTRFAAAPELYDLAADPGETRDLAAAEPVVAGWLRTLLRAERLAAATGSEQAELDAETREALGALGYL